nr:putative ribonuclease H-like domain-containing protein [Tanacetum cinerariifolium]
MRSKVERFNCHKNGHFAREYRAPKNQENRGREYGGKTMPVENPIENALIAQDGFGGYDWSYQAEEKHPTNNALMALTSSGSSSNSNSEKLKKAEKEIDELKLTLEKYQNSSKSLNTLLESQVRNYIPPKPDLMFIDEQVESEYVDVVSNVSSSAVKTVESIVNPPIIEDWNSKDESEVEFEPKVKVKTVRPCIEKIKFVKTAREKVEKLKYNLFSVSQICDKKNNVLFTDTGCLVLSFNFKLLDESQVLLRVPRRDNIYSVDLKSVVPTGVVAKFQTNGIARTKDNIVAGPKDSAVDARKKATEVDESQVSDNSGQDDQVTRSKFKGLLQQERQTEHIHSTNSFNTISSPVNTDGPSFVNAASPSSINVAGTPASTNAFEQHPFKRFSPFKNAFSLPHVPIVTPINDTRIFGNAYADEVVEEEVDMNNVILFYTIPDAPLTKFLKDHPKDQVIASTPMEPNKALVKDAEVEDVDVHLYRSMIGSLMYLTASRPDITFAVCACVRFQVTLKTSHLHAVKIIFRYLKDQPKLGLWYSKDSPFDLEAYFDSDYAGASLDRKSTTRGCQFLRKRLISWQCKKQTIVANSTTEAEYVDVASYCEQVLYIQNQMLNYGFNLMNTKIYIDNESIICIVKNLMFHSKTKHIEIRHHFIKYSYEKKLIQVIKIQIDYNIADLLTKAFDVKKPSESEGFKQIIDFLNAKPIRYALTVNLTIYALCVKQFWTTTKVKKVNDQEQIQTLVDKKKVIITEESIRRDLKFDDAKGTACLPNDTIFEELARMSEILVEESILTPSNDPLPSGENGIQLNELMIFYTNLQQHVLDLEKAKIAQAKEIAKLKKRIKKIEKRRKKKIVLGAQGDASKQGRSIEDIDQDAEITLVDEAQGRMHDADMFGVDDLEGNEVFVDVREQTVEKEVSTADLVTTAGEVVTAASIEVSVAPTTATTADVDDELTLAKTLIEIKEAKPKVISTAITTPRAKDIVFHEQVQAHIPTISSSKDKDHVLNKHEIKRSPQVVSEPRGSRSKIYKVFEETLKP